MTNKDKNKIIPQMFDVRPVKEDGDLDWEKIESIKKSGDIKKRKPIKGEISFEIKSFKKTRGPLPSLEKEKKANVIQFGRLFDSENIPIIQSASKDGHSFYGLSKKENGNQEASIAYFKVKEKKRSFFREAFQKWTHWVKNFLEQAETKWRSFQFSKKINLRKPSGADFVRSLDHLGENFFRKNLFYFSMSAVLILVFILTGSFIGEGLGLKEALSLKGQEAYAGLNQAKKAMENRDFSSSQIEFEKAQEKFSQISKDLNNLGGFLVKGSRFIPFLSKLSSGSYAASAGENISQIGVLVSKTVNTLNTIENPLNNSGSSDDSTSLLRVFQETQDNVSQINRELASLEDNLSKVSLDDIPQEQKGNFITLKTKLPEIRSYTEGFLSDNEIFTDVLGGNGPRKYLFLFQNNNEMRATGGFIGTYGILDIFNGHIRKFFVDGIFNPDGQLREKVVPPVPIQKISAAWSLHDSNWWPNFPTSAEKARWFFEKTGGPTVDGVISMTPVVMQKLLEVTGPIEMPEYNVTIDKDNFMEKVQNEVEVNYDKELNQPKKILADLAPKILDRIFNAKDLKSLAKTASILLESLNEKHILIYSTNYEIEKKLSEKGWAGEVMNTQKDYLSVVNTNINGFKTDGVVSEKIEHESEIQPDGSILDTVTITRHHNGGSSDKEWFNKVNADYMRVYVPIGSKLLSVEGQSREFNSPPLDYNSLGFKRDAQVMMEEENTEVDSSSGTRIYEDSEKTVFGNWVYVSPQETVVIKYRYLLPFKIKFENQEDPIGTFSLLAQKQSGSVGSEFISQIKFPAGWQIVWEYPDGDNKEDGKIEWETDLKTDKFQGIALRQ